MYKCSLKKGLAASTQLVS